MKRNALTLLLLFLLASSVTLSAQDRLTSDSIMSRHLQYRGVSIYDGNSVELLTNGHDKFEDLFREVRKAKKFLHLEYFNFRNDSIANLLFDILAEKAAEGVEVRALYDSFGNSSNNRPIKSSMHEAIRQRGINLVQFDPIKFPWVNHIIPRDHRKIVVIDGRVAFTGGMNVADYYITGIQNVGAWHDMHLHLEGPVVNELNSIFTDMWELATGEILDGEIYFPHNNPSRDNQRLAIINRHKGKSPDAIRDMFVTMLNSAKHSVKIISPYFVPTHRVRNALKQAIDRGIDVQILLSAKGDIPITPEASQYVGNLFAKRGAKVYLFEGGFHHTKIMMIDDLYCTVGSSNMDARSLRCDYEVNTIIFNKQTTAELTQIFEKQKESSLIMSKGGWTKLSAWHRFKGWFGNLLTPFL